MHIYFSGIGGAGIGPLALIAHEAGYVVSGSDKTSSQYTEYLQKKGINLHIGQTQEGIAADHTTTPIDWLVISSAVPLENPNHPELLFAKEHGIKVSKRDELLNEILQQKKLQLLAVAGTHGKTTTTAMLIWACMKLEIPVSYSVGAKISFGEMGHYDPQSNYFVYECDEFDRNFLAFKPFVAGITTIDWDHHDIYPTREAYKSAFRQFLDSSEYRVIFKRDCDYAEALPAPSYDIIADDDTALQLITLPGAHNRRNALVAAHMLTRISDKPFTEIISVLNNFPGSQRRFEKIADNIYSDYAHTPEEIAATLQLAHELSDRVVVVYEPLTNKRQHFMKDLYGATFESAEKVYWLPSYLAREDPNQHILTPEELISGLSSNTFAEPAKLDNALAMAIRHYADEGALVLCLAGGGGGSLDEWVRQNVTK